MASISREDRLLIDVLRQLQAVENDLLTLLHHRKRALPASVLATFAERPRQTENLLRQFEGANATPLADANSAAEPTSASQQRPPRKSVAALFLSGPLAGFDLEVSRGSRPLRKVEL